VDNPYSATFEAREGDGPYDWSIVGGTLPPGLTFNASNTATVTVEGTPTEVGTFTFTVRVEDQATGDWAEGTITLEIKPIPPPPTPNQTSGSSGCSVTGTIGGATTGGLAGNTRAIALLALFGIMAATAAAFRWKSAHAER
jgi:hypothetical protein